MQFLMYLGKREGRFEESKGREARGGAEAKVAGKRREREGHEDGAVLQKQEVPGDQGLLVHVLCNKMYLRNRCDLSF